MTSVTTLHLSTMFAGFPGAPRPESCLCLDTFGSPEQMCIPACTRLGSPIGFPYFLFPESIMPAATSL